MCKVKASKMCKGENSESFEKLQSFTKVKLCESESLKCVKVKASKMCKVKVCKVRNMKENSEHMEISPTPSVSATVETRSEKHRSRTLRHSSTSGSICPSCCMADCCKKKKEKSTLFLERERDWETSVTRQTTCSTRRIVHQFFFVLFGLDVSRVIIK